MSDHSSGRTKTSQNKQFSLVLNDGYLKVQNGSKKWTSGKVCLKERDHIIWIKDFERPITGAVSDYGKVALLHTQYRDSSKSISITSIPKEFIDLGSKLTVMEKSGEQIFTHNFGSNVKGCTISSDGTMIAVATLAPDNSVYCFELKQKRLLWKYKNHSRKVILGLRFLENEIEVFTGKSVATVEKEYILQIDGTLEPLYAKEKENADIIKKQKPEQKVESLMAMINSGEKQRLLEGLSQLVSFVTTKGSFSYHIRIVECLKKYIQTTDKEVFDVMWKVIAGILKRQPQVIEPLIPELLSRLKMSDKEDVNLLWYLDKLGGVNPNWIINELPIIKQKLLSKSWNERRFAACAIGSIGAININLVKEVISILVEYISNPNEVRKELEGIAKTDDQIATELSVARSLGADPATWLRDACIDSIGKIGKNFSESVKIAIPLLENLSKNAPSPYTIKKSKIALEAIQGRK